MASTILPADVVIGILTENTTRMLAQAIRLVRSIRWFGGGLADSRVVVCGVGELERGAKDALVALGAELRVVSRFHPANPTANRHQLIAELLDAPEALLFLLDCDTIVTRDPLPYLDLENFQAKIAPTPTVSDGIFERLFAHFRIAKPPRSHVTHLDRTPTIPYFNGGVLAIPRELARTLAPVWRKYNLALAEQPELVAPCQRHMHQASLSLALAETGIPCRELPVAMNLQINATHVEGPPEVAETDPVILHYHHLATDDGYLLPCPWPAVQARIDVFHDRLRAEGVVREPERRAQDDSTRALIVLGMHRSGTSLVAQIVSALGVWAGNPDELTPGDMFNPTGFWELGGAVRLNEEILEELGASVNDCASVDVSRIGGQRRRALIERASKVIEPLGGHGSFLLKDPRISLLLPFWRSVLAEPVCVIVWRHPAAVARSLATRDRLPTLWSLALWEHYNRTLLRESEGLPRVLVSYEELLARPEERTGELREALRELGVGGLGDPGSVAIEQMVKDDFNRSGRGGDDDEELLDAGQRALLADLRSGAVLRGPVAATDHRTLALIAEFGRLDASAAKLSSRLEALQRRLEDRDQLLKSVFESRSWRVGHSATSLLRRMTRPGAVSAAERWLAMRRESGE